MHCASTHLSVSSSGQLEAWIVMDQFRYHGLRRVISSYQQLEVHLHRAYTRSYTHTASLGIRHDILNMCVEPESLFVMGMIMTRYRDHKKTKNTEPKKTEQCMAEGLHCCIWGRDQFQGTAFLYLTTGLRWTGTILLQQICVQSTGRVLPSGDTFKIA